MSVLAAPITATASSVAHFDSLDAAVTQLSKEINFSGAIVIRGAGETRFSAAYGWADPFSRIAFETDTPVDSASLAKPMTAAAVLLLVREGRVRLDAPVVDYVSGFPHAQTTVRQLLAHSAGLPDYEQLEPIANKSNADLLAEIEQKHPAPIFAPGSAFSYCNTCYDTLALLIEQVTGRPYEQVLRERLGLPASVRVRPRVLAQWDDRAIGHRYTAGGEPERFDSIDGEAFYGGGNLSVSAVALADWGATWWGTLAPLRHPATASVAIGPGTSGLTLGSWFCSPDLRRCHYGGHHQGFHHMLYWDADRRLSIAMVTNSTLPADIQQRLQRAIIAFASDQAETGAAELRMPLQRIAPVAGSYRTPSGELVQLEASSGPILKLTRRGVAYDVYPIDTGIGYAPGLDTYVTGSPSTALHLLSVYEDLKAEPAR